MFKLDLISAGVNLTPVWQLRVNKCSILLTYQGYLSFLLSFVCQNQPTYMIFYSYIHTNIYAYFV